MLLANDAVQQVNFPRSLLAAGPPKREFIHRVRGIATLRRVGIVVDPTFTDDQGAPVPEEEARALREVVEPAVRDLAPGRAAHARRTIAELEASRKGDADQVDDLLDALYRAQANGERPRETLDAFLDTFERWLRRDGVAKVDMLFDRVDLERAPEPLGVLLLATTRLTREHFAHRDAFIERLRGWLIGRAGRTERSVDNILRGLRE